MRALDPYVWIGKKIFAACFKVKKSNFEFSKLISMRINFVIISIYTSVGLNQGFILLSILYLHKLEWLIVNKISGPFKLLVRLYSKIIKLAGGVASPDSVFFWVPCIQWSNRLIWWYSLIHGLKPKSRI